MKVATGNKKQAARIHQLDFQRFCVKPRFTSLSGPVSKQVDPANACRVFFFASSNQDPSWSVCMSGHDTHVSLKDVLARLP